MPFTGHGQPGVFAGPDLPGVFSGCCCRRKAILALCPDNGDKVLLVCVEDHGDEGVVEWTRELDTTGLAQPAWHGGQVFVAHTPAVGTDSVLRIRDKDGSLMASRALEAIEGGPLVNPTVAVAPTTGKVFVFSDGPGVGPDAWRLNLNLATELAVAVEGEDGEFFPYPASLSGPGRQRLASIGSIGPRIACASGIAVQLNPDLTIPRVPVFPAFWAAHTSFSIGGAPTDNLGGPDVLIAESAGGGLWNHTSYSDPGDPEATLIADEVRGTFATSLTDGATAGHVWVPISATEILKTPTPGGADVYTKQLGVDFLATGTWSTSFLDVLRDDKKRLWVLARNTNAGNERAILALYEEDELGAWTEKWQLDLADHEDVEWIAPSQSNFRGWTLNIRGGGFEAAAGD